MGFVSDAQQDLGCQCAFWLIEFLGGWDDPLILEATDGAKVVLETPLDQIVCLGLNKAIEDECIRRMFARGLMAARIHLDRLFFEAAGNGFCAIAADLLCRGADVNTISGTFLGDFTGVGYQRKAQTALTSAIEHGCLDAVCFLLDRGARLDLPPKYPALCEAYACADGCSDSSRGQILANVVATGAQFTPESLPLKLGVLHGMVLQRETHLFETHLNHPRCTESRTWINGGLFLFMYTLRARNIEAARAVAARVGAPFPGEHEIGRDWVKNTLARKTEQFDSSQVRQIFAELGCPELAADFPE